MGRIVGSSDVDVGLSAQKTDDGWLPDAKWPREMGESGQVARDMAAPSGAVHCARSFCRRPCPALFVNQTLHLPMVSAATGDWLMAQWLNGS